LGKPIKISTGRFGGDKERIGKVWAFSARSTPFAQVLRNSTRSPCTPNCTLHSLKNSLEPANDPIPLVPRGLTVRLGVCNAFQSLVGGSCIRLPAFSTEASGKAREQRKSGAESTRASGEGDAEHISLVGLVLHSTHFPSVFLPSAVTPLAVAYFSVLLLLAFVY